MTKLVAVLAYWMGLDALFYWLNRKAKRIITFHNVLPDDLYEDNIANGVSCSASEFRTIVRELKRKWRFSADVLDPKTLTLTFDDGYLNQYEVAAEILKDEGVIPAVLFPSGDVKDGKRLLVDELLHWVAYVPQDIVSSMGFAMARDLWIKELWPRFSTDSETHGRKLYDELNACYPFEKIYTGLDPEYKRLRLMGVTVAQLDELRKRGWQIGWHAKSHYPLSQLTDSELRVELDSPAEMRQACLSYPYGREDSVGKMAISIAEELGYPCAVSNMQESAWNTCRYFLPRTSLSSNKYLLHFSLSGVKHFLKYRKLLPHM